MLWFRVQIFKLSVAVLFLGAFLATSVVLAQEQEDVDAATRLKDQIEQSKKGSKVKPPKFGKRDIPELDPSTAGGALALLMGGTLVILERRRQKA